MNVMRQTVCLVVNPIMVNKFVSLFNCMSAGRPLDAMKAPAKKLSIKLVGARCSIFGRPHRGSTVVFLLLQRYNVGLAVEYSSCFILVLHPDELEVLHADRKTCMFMNHRRH